MLDKSTTQILKALSKLSDGVSYKVITSEEIISSLKDKSQYDLESLKQIIDFLEKQEYINIKFSEENTYCYSLLPKARIYLEQENSKTKNQKDSKPYLNYIFIAFASFLGSILALLLFFYLLY